MNDNSKKFRTLKGYDLYNKNIITHAMEDYIEMIYRICKNEEYVRINKLAASLNVKPSSSSKMVNTLKEMGLVDYEKYGIVKLTEEGYKIGEYLMHRHNVLQKFFCLINNSNDELEQIEQLEHFINKKTLKNIEKLIKILEKEKNN